MTLTVRVIDWGGVDISELSLRKRKSKNQSKSQTTR